MDDMFQSPMTAKIWDTYIDPGVMSLPTTLEIRDKNFNKLYNILLKDGYTYTLKIVKCTDGDEMEITEIRGPKASGFFFVENYGLRASDFLYTPTEHKHFFETVKK